MDSYPGEFAAWVANLGEEARCWAACQAGDDQDGMDQRRSSMTEIQNALAQAGVLSEETCQLLHDYALGAAAQVLTDQNDAGGLEDLAELFPTVKDSCPDEVSPQLWERTGKLFLSGARLTVAEVQGDEEAEGRQRRAYARHGRAIAGMGPAKTRAADIDMGEYADRAAKAIPATVVMFSGCQDSQTSADVFNTSSFGLPEDAGPGGAGGACTSSMVKALHENADQTWVSLLRDMRSILAGKYTQIPMLSSSRSMDLNSAFSVMHPESNGRCRALLVGINYVGMNGELRGCHNDVETMSRYLQDNGYSEGDMKILLDDGEHDEPTRANITEAFAWLIEGAEAGDSLFFHYSGHGASVKDDGDDEEDGKDEALVPLDYQSAGLIRDDETFEKLVAPLASGVWLTCLLDCCHSGTILDLPYCFEASDANMDAAESGEIGNMQANANFDFGKALQVLKDHPLLSAGVGLMAGAAYFMSGPEKSKALGRGYVKVMSSDDKAGALMGVLGGFFK